MGASRSLHSDPVVPPQPLSGLLAPLRAAGLLAADIAEADTILINRLADDSRDVGPGSLFIARKGDHSDGHLFLEKAVQQGAVAAIVDANWLRDATASAGERSPATSPLGKGERLPSAVFVPVSDTRAALAEVAISWFGNPGSSLNILGVTGTNGKTTTACLLHHLIMGLGQTCGLIGTIENRIGNVPIPTNYTTPEAIELNRTLRAMLDAACTTCAMEVSSHGLALDRVRGLPFRVGVFTNLTHDHLDFHGSTEAYEKAKKLLFDRLAPASAAVVNCDDPAWKRMTVDTEAEILTYGTGEEAVIRVEVLENALSGLLLRLDGIEQKFRLAGRFNALNLAAAYAVGRELGYPQRQILDVLADAKGVAGRFESFRSDDGVLGVVDYAHTPDALENVLRTARQIAGDGQLSVVFGCGGDRDRTKRPEMARVAEKLADRVILTNDNPRTEDPNAILDEIRAGFTDPDRALAIPDRTEAIRKAVGEADSGDIVVIAGKGHENYQIIGTEKKAFDDRLVLREALRNRPLTSDR